MISALFGTVDKPSASLGDTITYRHRIDPNAMGGAQLSDTIRVMFYVVGPGYVTETIPVRIEVTSPQAVAVTHGSLALNVAPDATAAGTFSITGGTGPFTITVDQGSVDNDNPAIGETVSYSKFIDSNIHSPGDTITDSITITPAAGSALIIPVTITVEQAPTQPISVTPSSLSLTGNAGDTPTTTFTITSGAAPFMLVSANAEGRGSFSNANPGLNEVVSYGFRIPGSATQNQQFTDTVTITGDDGVQVVVTATTTATVPGAGPGQDEIDEAMQSIANTQPQSATAAVISAICPAGVAQPRLQEDCDVVVGGALSGAGSNPHVQSSVALGQVTTDQASAPVHASKTSVGTQFTNIGIRMAALRGGAIGSSARGLSFNLDGNDLPVGSLADTMMRQLAQSSGGSAGSDQPLDFGRLGVFLNGTVTTGDKDRTANVEGFDFQTTGLTLGADYRFTDSLILGAAIGYMNSDTDLDAGGGELDSDGYSLSLYGTFYQGAALYLDGIISYGDNDYDQRRNIRYDIGPVAVNQSAFSNFGGEQFSISVGGGYTFSKGALSFGPTARVEYVKTDVDALQEAMSDPSAAGGGWATRIDGQTAKSSTLQLGGDLSYALSQSWGVLLPQVHLEWVHEFEDGGHNVVGHFVQDPTQTSFSLNTDSLDKDYFNLRLGISAQFAEGRSGYFYYQKLLGYDDLDVDSFSAGLRMEF